MELTAKNLEKYFDYLWPICRSITGNGLRESFSILKEIIPLELIEVPTGQKVLDWEIPKEWNIRDAYIIAPNGEKIVDFKKNNLHVVNYSVPVDREIGLDELQNHLHSYEHLPEAIPYITSYYKEQWGFCLTHNQRSFLRPGKYKVVIDSSLNDGALTYGTCVLPSTSGNDQEILLSSYLCHPSMANNELSGPLVISFLYNELAKKENRLFNYRFVIAPETIGIISFLSDWGEHLRRHLFGGYVITCCGDNKQYTYKKSKNDDSEIDRVAIQYLNKHVKGKNAELKVYDFFPLGSDERQYCSPGYNFNVGSIMRSMYGKYKEYHTSLDNKDFISFEGMKETVEIYLNILQSLEDNKTFVNLIGHGEPQLGRYNLYPSVGARVDNEEAKKFVLLMNYILSYSDGKHDLLSIAEKADSNIMELHPIAMKLREKGLLEDVKTIL